MVGPRPVFDERSGASMTYEEMTRTWAQARGIDSTLRILEEHLPALRRRQLRPVAFCRETLFSSMARGRPILFENLPVPVRNEDRVGLGVAVAGALRSSFPRAHTVSVRCGPSSTKKSLSVDELVRRWEQKAALVSVTDLHIRGTRVTDRIDTTRLSDFNLLAGARGTPGEQEMLTMVVGSAGSFTDSHSDDPDGSNHCFVGRKLWLVWDTFRGFSHGLQDVERVSCDGDQASFSISGFLAVPGSQWFTVESGQTLFLPGHLTHKVVTLEDYLGVGSFFVMLPSYWRTLMRWTRHTPLWALAEPAHRRLELVDKITRLVIRKLETLSHAPAQERRRWGLDQLISATEAWRLTSTRRSKSLMTNSDATVELLDLIHRLQEQPRARANISTRSPTQPRA